MPKYYDIEVTLKEIEPKIFRRFLLPVTATFADLHAAIQDACGWEHSHLHTFQDLHGEDFATSPHNQSDWGPKVPTDKKVKLADYFGVDGKKTKRCTYVYDFGDNWEHDVKLRGIVAEEKSFKRKLVDGARSFPPEDCGGTWGYEECLTALSGKDKSEDAKERLEWLGDWSPESFNLDKVRKRFEKQRPTLRQV